MTPPPKSKYRLRAGKSSPPLPLRKARSNPPPSRRRPLTESAAAKEVRAGDCRRRRGGGASASMATLPLPRIAPRMHADAARMQSGMQPGWLRVTANGCLGAAAIFSQCSLALVRVGGGRDAAPRDFARLALRHRAGCSRGTGQNCSPESAAAAAAESISTKVCHRSQNIDAAADADSELQFCLQ